jgi:uncharacterized repeat protein (TIGR03803 family)
VSGGDLFGVTEYGGAYGDGMVFRLAPSGSAWAETVVHNFSGGSDGEQPNDGLTGNSTGFFGTTFYGGASDKGTVFEVYAYRGGWVEKVLHSFAGGSDGANPSTAVGWNASDSDLYGTTQMGGTNNKGTAFTLTSSGSSWNETILHSFGAGTDGFYQDGAMTLGSGSIYYGTTFQGGSEGNGTVFELVP